MQIRDRVKHLRRVKARDLRPNPRNWRTHPQAQADALRGILAEVGFADALIARELEGGQLELIDGHLRAETTPDMEVPVLVLDVTKEEADKLLVSLDPLAAMAEADKDKLEALLKEMKFDSEALAELMSDLAKDHGLMGRLEGVVEDEPPALLPEAVSRVGDLWLLPGLDGVPERLDQSAAQSIGPPVSASASPVPAPLRPASAAAASALHGLPLPVSPPPESPASAPSLTSASTEPRGTETGQARRRARGREPARAGGDAGVAGGGAGAGGDAGEGGGGAARGGGAVGPGEGRVRRTTVPATGHRLLCGDATKSEDVAAVMQGLAAQLVATDPPYLVDYTGARPKKGNRATGKDWSAVYREVEIADAELFFSKVFGNVLTVVAPRAAVYCWHAHRRCGLIQSVWQKLGILDHQQIIWVKPAPVFGRVYWHFQHEPCMMGWVQGSQPEHDNDHSCSSVWTIDWEGKGRVVGNEHPTQKPVEIFARPMRKHTRVGDVCFEPFSGSGTQLIAAEQLGRRCIAIEIEPRFVDVAIRRWQRLTGREALRASDGLTWRQAAQAAGVELPPEDQGAARPDPHAKPGAPAPSKANAAQGRATAKAAKAKRGGAGCAASKAPKPAASARASMPTPATVPGGAAEPRRG